jgi:hypothetical protein
MALVAAVPASAQEPPLPEGAIAQVGDDPVLKSDFDAWYPLLALDAQWLRSDPPDYARCIATLDRRAARRGRNPSRRSLRRRCEGRQQVVHEDATRAALLEVWVRQEGVRVGAVVTLQQVARRVARLQRAAGPVYRRLLRSIGLTEDQFARLMAFSMQMERLVDRVRATIPEVTKARVRSYLAQHQRKYRHVSRRRALKRIRLRLELEREYRAFSRFQRSLTLRYSRLTQCAQGYIVEQCANAESPGVDEDVTHKPFRQSSTSISTFPGAGYTGAASMAIAQPSS